MSKIVTREVHTCKRAGVHQYNPQSNFQLKIKFIPLSAITTPLKELFPITEPRYLPPKGEVWMPTSLKIDSASARHSFLAIMRVDGLAKYP